MNKAFTLVELVVTLGIMVMLLAAAIPSFNNYNRFNELYQFGQSIKSDVLSAKNYALSPSAGVSTDTYRVCFLKNPDLTFYYAISYGFCNESSKYLEQISFGKEYGLTLPGGGNSFEVDFPVAKQGGITTSPVVSLSDVHIKLTGNLIKKGQNSVDIIVNTISGQVSLQ